jgi:hypothetical protein
MAEIRFCSEIVDDVKGKVVVMTGIAHHFALQIQQVPSYVCY